MRTLKKEPLTLQNVGVDAASAARIIEKLAELRFRDSIGSHCPMVPFSDLTWPSANSLEATELGRGGFGVVLLASLQVLSAACFALTHRLP